MNHTIVPLPREQWQDAVLPIGYTTTEYYDVSLERRSDGFALSILKKTAGGANHPHAAGARFSRPAVCCALAGRTRLGNRRRRQAAGRHRAVRRGVVEPTACHRALGGPVAAKARLRARADGDCQTAGAACPPPGADFGDPVGKRQCHRILPA